MSQPISNGLLDLKLLGHWLESNPSHYHLNAIPSFEVVTETNSPFHTSLNAVGFAHSTLSFTPTWPLYEDSGWEWEMWEGEWEGVGSVGRIHWTDIQERNTGNIQSVLFYLLIEKETTCFSQWKMLGEKKQTQMAIFMFSIISQYSLK